MSMTRSVGLLAKTLTSPPLPAGTMAALAVTVPVSAFRDATVGCACPLAHAVTYPSGPFGMAAKLSEYACADAGMPQPAERTWKPWVWPPEIDAPLRVSATRHGVTG